VGACLCPTAYQHLARIADHSRWRDGSLDGKRRSALIECCRSTIPEIPSLQKPAGRNVGYRHPCSRKQPVGNPPKSDVQRPGSTNDRSRQLAVIHVSGQIELMLQDELSNLRRVIADGGTALEIDDTLLPLLTHSDPCIISPILTLLNKSGDQDGMWSILHTAESFEGSPYITGMLTALPLLSRIYPWWAQTLVIRVLNSEKYTSELSAQLRDAPALTKEVAAAICEELR